MKQYDPKEVSISWNNISLNEGIAEGTFILAERNAPDWTQVVGSDGEVTRIRTNDASGVVTVTLKRGSAVNALLTTVLAADKLSANAVGGLTIKDNQGNSRAVAATAYIEGPPPMEFSNTETTNAWRFLCDRLELFHRGSAQISG